MAAKSTGTDMEQNYATVTICIRSVLSCVLLTVYVNECVAWCRSRSQQLGQLRLPHSEGTEFEIVIIVAGCTVQRDDLDLTRAGSKDLVVNSTRRGADWQLHGQLQSSRRLQRTQSFVYLTALPRVANLMHWSIGHCEWWGGKVKVKFSHTRYWALGPELIPVYRQSARRWRDVNHAIDPAVGCRYFLPSLRLPP